MIISVKDLIDTSNMQMTDKEIYEGLVRLGYIAPESYETLKFTCQLNQENISTDNILVQAT